MQIDCFYFNLNAKTRVSGAFSYLNPYAARNYPIVKIISLPADGLKTKYNDSWCKEAYNGGRKNERDAKYD